MRRHLYLLALIAATTGALRAQGLAAVNASAAAQTEYVPLEAIRAGEAPMPAALARPVSVRARQLPLEEALRQIAAQADLGISYGEDLVRSRTLVSLDVRGVSAADAMAAAADGTGWRVLVAPSGLITVVRSPPVRHSMVAGQVGDAAGGQPVAGAEVAVLGTRFATLSDTDGSFALPEVPPGVHRVRVTHLGYAPREETVRVAVGRRSELGFLLEPAAIPLEGIVAIGYGTQRRRDFTGSLASVSAEAVQATPVTSVEQVLQGRAAGVLVTRNTGAPGGAVSVRIRGTNSISANSEPLYVVDGVPAFVGSGSSGNARSGLPVNPLADLSPSEIESIEVLKDASATAIYGSRGANGVVLITTRRGSRGENSVRIESTYGVQRVTKTIDMLDARQFAEVHNEARVNAGLQPLYTPEQIARLGEGTDWQGELLRSGAVQNHALTISGGDERTRYLITGGFFDQEGIVVSSGFRRYAGRLNLDRELSRRFRIGNSLTLSRTVADITATDASLGSGVIMNALQFAPTVPVRDESGGYVLVSPLNQSAANPVATAREIVDTRTASRLVGNVFGEYDLTDALRFRLSLGGHALFERESYYAPSNTYQGLAQRGEAVVGVTQSAEVVNDHILTYRRELREGHRVDLTGGFTLHTHRAELLTAAAEQFATDITGANNLGAGALPLSPGSDVDEWTLLSWLGRANYSLRDRYLFTVTGRYDGSSKFGRNSKWGFFPSAAFAWRLSNEAPLKAADWLTDAKLRVSYGATGNQEIGTYTSLARLQDYRYVVGTRLVTTYAPADLAPNPDLKWESSRQVDLGLDLSLFDNRVGIVVDVYRSITDDLLLRVPLPAASGYSEQFRNVGSVRNRGVELALGTVNVERGSLSWRTTLNLARNRNEVVELGGTDRIFPAGIRGEQAVDGGAYNVVQVGQPLGAFFGYRTDGIWQLGDAYRNSGDPFAAPGEWRVVDVNADGVINADDRTILGSPEPELFGGVTNHLSLGPLTLDVFLQGAVGGEVLNAGAVFLKSGTTSSNEYATLYQRWTPQNPSNTVPRAYLNRSRRLIESYVEDASYVRLQNVTLACRLPERVVPGARRARVYLGAQNLALWSRYSGFDPEANSYGGNPALRGIDLGTYPRSRGVHVGVNLTF